MASWGVAESESSSTGTQQSPWVPSLAAPDLCRHGPARHARAAGQACAAGCAWLCFQGGDLHGASGGCSEGLGSGGSAWLQGEQGFVGPWDHRGGLGRAVRVKGGVSQTWACGVSSPLAREESPA